MNDAVAGGDRADRAAHAVGVGLEHDLAGSIVELEPDVGIARRGREPQRHGQRRDAPGGSAVGWRRSFSNIPTRFGRVSAEISE